MDNIIHFVGMNNLRKETFIEEINNKNNIIVHDLDKITLSIRNNPQMITLNNKLTKNIKNIEQKRKLTKEIHLYWKELFQNKINNIITRNKSKKIIFIGLSTYHKNHLVKINIPTTKKYFIKSNINTHINEIIEFNLDRYRNHIIKGTFPLKYLDRDFLTKQRIKVENIYIKNGFVFKNIDQIIKEINELSIPFQNGHGYSNNNYWYVAMSKNISDKQIKINSNFKNVRGRRRNIKKFLYGEIDHLKVYKEPWLAITNSLKSNIIKKGFLENKHNKQPFIEELYDGSFIEVHQPVYLYKILYETNDNKNELVINNDIDISEKIYIDDVYHYLKKNNVRLIKYQKT